MRWSALSITYCKGKKTCNSSVRWALKKVYEGLLI